MDGEAPEEDSNSLNVNFTISEIQQLRQNTFRISFLNREPLEITKAVFFKEHLYPGLVLSFRKIEDLKFSSLQAAAEAVACRLLARYQHSTSSLKLKLKKRGYSEEITNSVTVKMQSMGYLDDEEFARVWVLARMEKHPEGKNFLLAGLKKRGIPGELARRIITELVTSELEKAGIGILLRHKNRMKNLNSEQIRALLLSRGFSKAEIQDVLEEM